MSKRRNGTNRAGAAIGVNRYTGKLMPRKKKNLPAATGQAQELKKQFHTLIVRDIEEDCKNEIIRFNRRVRSITGHAI